MIIKPLQLEDALIESNRRKMGWPLIVPLVVAVVFTSLFAAHERAEAQGAAVSKTQVFGVADEQFIDGTRSVAIRTSRGVLVMIHTRGLTAGNVATVSFSANNNPDGCNGPAVAALPDAQCGPSDLFNPDSEPVVGMKIVGRVVRNSGRATFIAFLPATDNGLSNPHGAEIVGVLTDVGPADPALLSEQLNTDPSTNLDCYISGPCVVIQAAQHTP